MYEESDNVRSRATSTLQSASLPNSNLTPDGQKVLKRLKTDENIAILTADKGRATFVMDKTDYNGKMNSHVNDKQTYEVLKRDPTPALQCKINNKLFTLKKTDKIDFDATTGCGLVQRAISWLTAVSSLRCGYGVCFL